MSDFTPSAAQRAAIECSSTRTLIIAGPGSGKTATMVRRAEWFLDTQAVDDPEQISFLTFTVAAAREVENRIGHDVWSNTFHAFCFRLLVEYGDRIVVGAHFLRPPFTVLDETDQRVLLEEVLKDLRWKGMSVKKLADWYNLGCQEGMEPKLARGMSVDGLRGVIHEYEQRLADSNAIDFTGLVKTLIRILVLDTDFLLYTRNRFKVFMLDEGQDINPIQLVLVRLLLRPDTYLTVVGDPDQTLYSWRLADPRLVLGKEVPVHGLPSEVHMRDVVSLYSWGHLGEPESVWTVHHIGENWRSDRAIVEGSRRLIEHNQERHTVPLESMSQDEGGIFLYRYPLEAEEQAILRLVHHEKGLGGTLGVLTRTNWMARHVGRMIRDEGFEVFLVGEENDMWEDEEAKRLLYLLRVASNRYDRWTALRVLHMLAGQIPPVLLSQIREEAALTGDAILEVAVRLDPNLDLQGLTHLHAVQRGPEQILAAFMYAKTVMQPWTPICERIEAYASAWARAGRSLPAFLFFVSYHAETFRESKEIEPGTIWVSTVHTAKGLEWDTVIVAGCEPGEFPPRDMSEEERRIFYVAATRPRHRLIFSVSDQRQRYGRQHAAGPSEFLKEAWPLGIQPLDLGSATEVSESLFTDEGGVG